MERIYLDHAATTPVDPAGRGSDDPYFTANFGNPSVSIRKGRGRKGRLKKAGKRWRSSWVQPTPGRSSLPAAAPKPTTWPLPGWPGLPEKGNHIITSAIEHHAVLETCKDLEKHGFTVTYLPVDEYGLVDPEAVREAITGQTILISVMHANNEVGTIQPIAEISKIAHEKGVLFHTDAVQTVGSIPLDLKGAGGWISSPSRPTSFMGRRGPAPSM